MFLRLVAWAPNEDANTAEEIVDENSTVYNWLCSENLPQDLEGFGPSFVEVLSGHHTTPSMRMGTTVDS